MTEAVPQQAVLEGGTYEIIRGRLASQGQELLRRLGELNAVRKDVFGSIETKLVESDRLTTENNCVARDMVSFGRRFLFGYNVRFGLKSKVELTDVFALYEFGGDHSFTQVSLDEISSKEFIEDFNNLYKYYKETQFARFFVLGLNLFMVFRIGKRPTDVKTFKWAIEGSKLIYIDNRSDHEYKYPEQHEFRWKRTTRDMHRAGKHPHISIEDKVFVEAVGGDLTIKIEDNTESGTGILSEPVENPDQILDDADIQYAIVGSIVLLRIRPYQETETRYFIYNEKTKAAIRIDDLANACVLLPDSHGLMFPTGAYLVTGEARRFDHGQRDMLFERRIAAPNGEDYVYIFYNRERGTYILLSYNIIEQRVDTPVICQGFAIFETGELVYFNADPEPQKHHVVQIWQTPFVGPNFVPRVSSDNYLYKIGNKDIVRAMAECHEVLRLIGRDTPYEGLYTDLVRKAQDIVDSYFWVGDDRAVNLKEALGEIKATASAAIDEFTKVVRIRKQTTERIAEVTKQLDALLSDITRKSFQTVDHYVQSLADLRSIRGEVISLRELRYADLDHVANLEARISGKSDELSASCVEFLLLPNALDIYTARIAKQDAAIESIVKVADAKELEEAVADVARELELLIEIVSNLKIEDSTKTTQIIDNISALFTTLNQVRSKLARRRKDLAGTEAIAEFGSQMKLLQQGVINYLDVCDSPAKCDEYLNKLLVQVEELEGRFADFDDFVLQLAEKREEAASAFESRKLSLIESRNKRAVTLQSAAERILKGVENRARNLKTVSDINGFYATDLMIDKVRSIIADLRGVSDSVKADDIEGRLKSSKEDAIRQLKDRMDLFEDGDNVIKFGKHRFSVNTQPLDLTTIVRDGDLFFHITGTNFFEKCTDEALLATKPVWSQQVVSENEQVYRAEFLAYQFLKASEEGAVAGPSDLKAMGPGGQLEELQKFMAPRFTEGYVKGVHDQDAALIVAALVDLHESVGLLRFGAASRACARVWWEFFATEEERVLFSARLHGLGAALHVFPHRVDSTGHVARLAERMRHFCSEFSLFPLHVADQAAEYLFHELTRGGELIISSEAAELVAEFQKRLDAAKGATSFRDSIGRLAEDHAGRFDLIRRWLSGFVQEGDAIEKLDAVEEAAALLLGAGVAPQRVRKVHVARDLAGMTGAHAVIEDGSYHLNYPRFVEKMVQYERTVVPMHESYVALKKHVADEFRDMLRLDEFKPRVLTSFVRNRLIDEVYLPILGDNLAKQMGTTGENKRTDRMGMLLLVSPPGYGKTTLMEYVANRLGIIFMKINGPAIGNRVLSLDPAEAPNATAREELEKLNLSLEMGDNVMIYLDDIQHCDPEFLQKFISLCDAQRKIEGVWRGRTRTYDLRGRKVCVVMAGNPYTESGDKFRIPDMLANRADTYNLGDILGDKAEQFKLSYIENSMTSNTVLARVAARSGKDIHALALLAQSGNREGIEFEGNYSTEELNEIVGVLKKMFAIRDVVLRVNEEYIRSAAMSDEFRTEPAFKLQGSYRNMNKLAEKVIPIMNDEELRTLILTHYESESQTLTTGTEANMLKFKTTFGFASDAEAARWNDIQETFRRNQKFRGLDAGDSMVQAVTMLGDLGDGIGGLRREVADGLRDLTSASRAAGEGAREVKAVLPPETLEALKGALLDLKGALSALTPDAGRKSSIEGPIRAEFSAEAMEGLRGLVQDVRELVTRQPTAAAETPPPAGPIRAEFAPESLEAIREAISQIRIGLDSAATMQAAPPAASGAGAAGAGEWRPKDGEFRGAGSLRTFLEGNGFGVEEIEKALYRVRRGDGFPIYIRILEDRFYMQVPVGDVPPVDSSEFYRDLLDLNTRILPVSVAIDRREPGRQLLVVLESREGSSLTKNELNAILRGLEYGHAQAKELLERHQA